MPADRDPIDPAGVLTHIRDEKLTAEWARYYACAATGSTDQGGFGMLRSPWSPEKIVEVVAFWNEVADMIDRGEADWID